MYVDLIDALDIFLAFRLRPQPNGDVLVRRVTGETLGKYEVCAREASLLESLMQNKSVPFSEWAAAAKQPGE